MDEHECPRYTAFHHILRNISLNILLYDILRTKGWIFALTEFLKLSGAFSRTDQAPEPPLDPDNSEAGKIAANRTL